MLNIAENYEEKSVIIRIIQTNMQFLKVNEAS